MIITSNRIIDVKHKRMLQIVGDEKHPKISDILRPHLQEIKGFAPNFLFLHIDHVRINDFDFLYFFGEFPYRFRNISHVIFNEVRFTFLRGPEGFPNLPFKGTMNFFSCLHFGIPCDQEFRKKLCNF